MKRALKKRVKAVLNNIPNKNEAPVEPSQMINPKANRRARTQAAMIGLAISMGATSLLVTRQSDQAQAAAPVGSQNAATSIPAASETEMKFVTTKLESQAVSFKSVPENSVIVEPTAVSQVPGLEAKWQIAANKMAVNVPTSEASSQSSKVANQNSLYLQPQVVQGIQTANNSLQTGQEFSNAEGVAGNKTASSLAGQPATTANGQVNAQLKAQQEFALNRLQQKSQILRQSLAQLRSGETQNLSQPGKSVVQPTITSGNTVIAQIGTSTEAKQSSLISRLKQSRENSAAMQQLLTAAPAAPKVAVQSAAGTYEVKPGDTIASIASSYGISVSQLLQANNLSDAHQLRISQKLVIPSATEESKTTSKSNVGIQPTIVQPHSYPRVNFANLPRTTKLSPTVTAKNDNSVSTPTAVTGNVPETIPAPVQSYGMGGDTPVPRAFTEINLAQNPEQTVARSKGNERLRSLQQEIERLRQKYRAQQSGVYTSEISADVSRPEVSETDNAAITIPVSRPGNFSRPSNYLPNAVQIAVPNPILPTYSAAPVRNLYRSASRSVQNEAINPEFLPNRASADGYPSRSAVNSSESLGRLRGTTVSPSLPPLAAVDQYLPRAIDPATSSPFRTSVAYIWPAKGVLTSGYGMRWGRMHRGIDIANSTGTPIFASADGVIQTAGWNNGGYGNLVEIRHADGSMTRYGHNSRIFVQVGQQVHQGQNIAAMGSTGFSTGPHTHFEVHPGGKGAVNPIAFLPNRV